jgi:amidohydrolase
VTERNEAEYRSANAGVMHACGHDGHMSVLLEASRWFAPRRAELAGTLVFCFQPGEEGRDGNRRMILDGALENPHIDRTFALHLYSGLDVGLVGVRDGAFFASADLFTVEIRGKGGHGGMPEGAVDPVVGAAQLVGLLQTIVSREIPPKHPAVVTVGRISAGTASSVIPENAELVGTVRCLNTDIRRSMPERIERIVRGLCQALRLEYSFSYEDACPPTVNDSAVNDVVRRVGRKIVGAENLVEHDVVMWSEDMAFMQEQRPGAYFLVGARGGESTAYPHHNAHFDLDERALDIAYRMMLGIGLEN